jgi:MFS family permease
MARRRRLLINPRFARLWLGESVSLMGSRISDVAVPLTALLVLGADPAQIGILSALQYAPIVFVTLPAGALVDRCRPRRVILATNAGRAVILTAAGTLALAGVLTLLMLAALAFSVGVLTAVFDVAYISFLPEVVGNEDLVEANARLEASSSAAEMGGKAFAGVLVQLAGAPLALLADASTYAFSAAAVLGIRCEERKRAHRSRVSLVALLADIRLGVALTFRSAVLRPLMLQSAWLNTLLQVLVVVVPIYALTVLGLSPAALGGILATGSAAALAGCIVAQRLGERQGIRAALIAGMALACCATALLPLASGPAPLAAGALALGYAIHGFGLGIFNVHSLAMRQRVTPAHAIGRTVASYRLATWGGIPLGALLGGMLTEALGPRETLAFVAAGLTASAVLFALVMRAPRLEPALRLAAGQSARA